MRIGRRGWLTGAAASVACWATSVAAQQASVPVGLQVQLLSRVVQYDRSFGGRAGASAVVLVVSKSGNAASARTAAQIGDALRRLGALGGVPITVEAHTYSSSASLASAAQSSHACIVYLSTGLSSDVASIAAALSGNSVMTVSASDVDATAGAVLAFELVEARPRLVVNLTHARRQRITFSSQLLRLARVIDT